MIAGKEARTWRADLALTVVVGIWGATFVLVKEALSDSSTLLFLAMRFSLATVALGLVFAGRYKGGQAALSTRFAWDREACPRRSLLAGVLAGVCLFGGYFFQTAGLRHTTASKSAFITALSIVLVPLFVSLVHRNVPHLAELMGVVLAVAGLGLMTLEPGKLTLNRGDMLTTGCAVAFALHVMVLGQYSAKVSVELLSLGQIATTALIALSTFWWAETPYIRLSAGLITALIVTSLLATALAFTVQTWAQRHTSPTRTALILALEPVFALLASILVAGERVSGRGLAGGLLILGGVLLAELKPPLRWGHPLK